MGIYRRNLPDKSYKKPGYPVIKLFFKDIFSISLEFKDFLKFRDHFFFNDNSRTIIDPVNQFGQKLTELLAIKSLHEHPQDYDN